MDAEYRGLGFDPAPGSRDAAYAAADRFRTAAEHASTAGAALREVMNGADGTDGTGGTGGPWWSGAAAAAFAAGLERAPAELAAAQGTMLAAADVLDGWAGVLRDHQREADQLDWRALELRRALGEAADDVRGAASALDVAIGSAVRTAHMAHAAALARHDDVRNELERVLAEARELRRRHEAAARRVADRLRALGGDVVPAARGPSRDELFDGLAGTLGSYSAHTAELASTLLGTSGRSAMQTGPDTGPATGAASRFAAAVAGPPTGPPTGR